jgi:hypothetical protein
MAIVSLVSATTWLITGMSLSSFGATAGHDAALMSIDLDLLTTISPRKTRYTLRHARTPQ